VACFGLGSRTAGSGTGVWGTKMERDGRESMGPEIC
jgi:hypothetical protein